MPATVTTSEPFDKNVTEAELDAEINLRLKAGAITSSKQKQSDGSWLLITEWNVIGEQ